MMKRRLILTSVAAAAVVGAMAQVNSPGPAGYLERGTAMYRDHNYQGAVDQLNQLKRLHPAAAEVQDADYYIAMAHFMSGNLADARECLERFVAHYPASPHTLPALMSIADCWFYGGDYSEALQAYDAINAAGLDLSMAEDYDYRINYCRMKLGDYDAARSGFASLRGVTRYANAARFYEGYIDYATGNYRQAKSLLESVDSSTAPGDRADYYLAQIAYYEGDYDKALSLARKSMERVPDLKPEMERIAGESLFQLGREDEAVAYLRSYVAAVEEPQISTLYILGVSEYKAGDYEQAVNTLGPVTRSDDAMGQSAYLYIGQSYLKLGNVNAAIMALENAYRMDYNREVQETAFYNYAVARMEGGRTPFGSSVELFEDFLRRYPDSRYAPEVQEYLVTGYMTDNNYEKALASIERIKRPTRAILAAKQQVLYTLGSRDLASGRFNSALQRFNAAKAINGQNAVIANECNLCIGDCYYRQGKYVQAAKSLNDYLKNAPAGSDNRTLALYDLGYAMFAQKKYSDAMSAFNRAIRSTPSLDSDMEADAYNRIGDCHYYASEFNQAAANYEKAYELNPAAGDYALFQKAMMRGLARDYSGKITILDEMAAKYPSSVLMPSILLEKAECFIELDQPGKAVTVYKELVNTYPSTSQGRNGYLQLAITQLGQGQKSEAINAYKHVISSYPTSEEARVASDDLKRILADDGRLQDYVAFIKSVPEAPSLEVGEMDQLTFQAAEKAYLNDNTATDKLADYIRQYPQGQYEPQALNYLMAASVASGNDDKSLEYASAIVERYPHSEAAEDALAVKGTIEYGRGDSKEAHATFSKLEQIASASRNVYAARLGLMRTARDLGDYNDVLSMTEKLLASTAIPANDRSEIRYSRGYALAQLARADEAVAEWKALADDTDDEYGAKSAYYLSQHYFDNNDLKKAQSTVEKLIDSNTPHSYWLARGFILLSDIYRHQGNDFEADEYLKSLKSNYPGQESDIFMMIEQRLK